MISCSKIICSSLIVILGIGLSCAHKYALPKDPKAPVVVLTYEGGYTPPRVNDEPELQILADGTVILGAPFGLKKRIESKIERQRLMQLLSFLLDEQQLAKFDTQKLQAAIRAEEQKQGQAVAIADAATTIVRIRVNGKTVEAECYALSILAQQYPNLKELSQLEAARKYLEKLRWEIYAGGKQGLALHLNLANQQLKEKYPSVPSLTAGDLQSSWQLVNNNVHVSFSREEQLDGGKWRLTSVDINILAGKEPQVSVVVNIGVKK